MKLDQKRTFVTVHEAAEKLRLSRSAIYSYCGCGILDTHRTNGRILIDELSLGFLMSFRRERRMARKPKHLRLIVNNDK
ncbi:hypothetical protein HWD97_22915 [Ochrobactrum sp. C6C9]|uniref:hypothetical protein n=1 Tax=Ochrobactrum sp. C6C9 TaxID=2736662 RepID=UPI00352FF35E|nr:hypothetical protein [Ochrobactrum sp. C6C9]